MINKIKYRFLRWIVKNYSSCAFGHKRSRVYEPSQTNCVYKCDKCGDTWTAY